MKHEKPMVSIDVWILILAGVFGIIAWGLAIYGAATLYDIYAHPAILK